MAVCCCEHDVLLGIKVTQSACFKLLENAGLDAFSHMYHFGTYIDDALALRLGKDEGSCVKLHQNSLHNVAEGVIAGAYLRNRSCDVAGADTDEQFV